MAAYENEARVTVRMPGKLHEKLAEIAESEHRSINGQIVYILEKYIEESEQQE